MSDFDGFAPIEAIFYTVFHPTEGTKVSHQVPLGAICTPQKISSDILPELLFDFDLVKNYIIPKTPLCNRLITLKVGEYRLVGFPVSITESHYARNSFSFNFCFVFKYDCDTTPYESAIRRLGRLFKNLEEQYQLLSKMEQDKVYFKNAGLGDNSLKDSPSNEDEALAGRSFSMESTFAGSTISNTYNKIVNDLKNKTNSSTPIGVANKKENFISLDSIESLIQQIFQDLNNYSECLIAIDSGNSVDIKLLPLLPPPPRINPEDVPISTVHLKSLVDLNWDITMLKILPYINGINSIKKISVLADSDYFVVKSCIQHLMYYKCIIISDIFQFSNIYAPTSNIDLFLRDSHMASECQAYVVAPSVFQGKPFEANSIPDKSAHDSPDSLSRSSSRVGISAVSLLGSSHKSQKNVVLPSKAKLFYLYRSLHQGQSVKNWYKEHASDLTYIDLRRFLTFGVLRGLIYRVNSYPIIDSVIAGEDSYQDSALASYFESLSIPTNSRPSRDEGKFPGIKKDYNLSQPRRKTSLNLTDTQKLQIPELMKHLQAIKSFDAICTEMDIDRKTLDGLLRKIGAYNTVNS